MWGSSDDDHIYDAQATEESQFINDLLSHSHSIALEAGLDDADCYLSEDSLQELLTPPSQTEWKDFLSADNPALITFDSSKAIQWDLTKKEIEHVRTSFLSKLQVERIKDVTMTSILMHCLGPESATGIFLRESLDMSRKTYLQFIGTTCFQTAYKVSSTQMYHENSKLKHCTLMPEAEFNLVWRRMSRLKKIAPNQISTSRRQIPLWETVERILNELAQSISVSGRKGKISIALDDDKVWLHISNSVMADLFNLKYSKHIKPNRNGITVHTAVSTGANLLLGVAMERTKDSSPVCCKRVLDFLFSQDGSTNLANVTIHSDRGYMIPSLAIEYMLANGGDFVGTVKRMAQCWPFTYKQTLKPTDKRTVVDVKGAPTLMLKYLKTPTRYVFASAFRNGSEAVATAVSTLHSQHQWEAVTLKPDELKKWKEDKESLVSSFFQRITSLVGKRGCMDEENEEEKAMMRELLEEKIEPFALRQGTADWHYLRKFSLTSSQAHKAFLKILPAFLNNPSFIKVAEFLYGHQWKTVLKIGNRNTSSARAQEHDNEEEADVSEDARLNPPLIQDYVRSLPIADEDDNAGRAALHFVQLYVLNGRDGKVLESEDEAKESVAELSSQTKKNVFKILSSQVTHVPYRKVTTLTKDIHIWLQKPNSVRNFLFYKAQGLKDLIAARGIELDGASKTISNMVDALSESPSARVACLTTPNATQTPNPVPSTNGLSPKDEATRAVLEKSFLPHRKGQAREHCSLGHRLEVPVLQSWIEVMEGFDSVVNGFQVHGAYSAGLAAKKDAIYAKDSIDFLVNILDPEQGVGDLTTWGFEVKARVTARSAAAERRNLQLDPEIHIRINEGEVHEKIADQGERFQIMQHSYVYDLDTVVLAISDNQSELIRSLIVDFSTEIRNHFGVVLEKIKKATLEWAYPELTRRPQVVKIPRRILQIAETIKTINGAETLQGTANLWLSLCKLPKPFPSMSRLIPAIYAFWNVVKGGSDTTTKLMDDSATLRVPKMHLNTETAAIARLLILNLTLVHRLSQVFTAKEDLEKYQSLYHYRHAANQRLSFHSTLLHCGDAFKRELEMMQMEENARAAANNNNENLPPAASGIQQRRRQPLRERINGVVPERVEFGASLSMKTPKKLKKPSVGNLPIEVEQMFANCTGVPMKSHPVQYQRCNECGKKTSWYCVGCKRWLCVERKVLRKDSDNLSEKMDLYKHESKGKDIFFQKVCFHKVHQCKWGASKAGSA